MAPTSVLIADPPRATRRRTRRARAGARGEARVDAVVSNSPSSDQRRDRVRRAALAVEAGDLDDLDDHTAAVDATVEVNDEVDRLVQLAVRHLGRETILARAEVQGELVERADCGRRVDGGQRRLAVRHRLQHRNRRVGVADLTAHQPVGPHTVARA